MTQNQLDRIHNAINSGRLSLNLNLGLCSWHPEPRQPITIQIASSKKKGCKNFYNILRARQNDRGDPPKHEAKWHTLLGNQLSVTFWDNAWKLHASIRENNHFKWIECQILRNSIYTNNRVAKFKHDVSDQCDLCGEHVENALTLFTQCQISVNFWAEIRSYLLNFAINLPTSRLQLLFGKLDEGYDSQINTIIMIGKRVIWTSKYKKNIPTISHFKASLKDYLVLLKVCKTVTNCVDQITDQWGAILCNLIGDQHVP